jgi:hypothetical protein
MTWHTNKQEYIVHNEQKNPSDKSNLELTHILDLVGKVFAVVILNVFSMLKS